MSKQTTTPQVEPPRPSKKRTRKPRTPEQKAREAAQKKGPEVRAREAAQRIERMKDPEYRERLNARDRARRKDPEVRERLNAQGRARTKERMKDPVLRERCNTKSREYQRERRKDPEVREHRNTKSRERRKSPECQGRRERENANQRARTKERRTDPDARERLNAQVRERRDSLEFRAKAAARAKSRYASDPVYRAVQLCRSRLTHAMQAYGAGKRKPADQYGVDYYAIAAHVGTSPGPGYALDHIMPCAAFDHSCEDEIRACWDPRNFRWLLAAKNISDSDKWLPESQAVADALLADHPCLAHVAARAQKA